MGAWVKVKCPLCTYLTHFHLRSEEKDAEEIAAKVAILREEHPKHPRRL